MMFAGILLAASLTLTWSEPELTDSILVERAPAAAGPFAQIALTAPGATAYVDSSVAPGTTYFYRIAAVNQVGVSRYSNVASGTVPAQRAPLSATLKVVKSGNGQGTVTSAPAGIRCGTDCAEAYRLGASITLTARSTAARGRFAGWSGACAGTGSCVVTMSQAKTVTARFTRR